MTRDSGLGILVTVGSTSFDPLIAATSSGSFCRAASRAGFQRITLQIGAGNGPLFSGADSGHRHNKNNGSSKNNSSSSGSGNGKLTDEDEYLLRDWEMTPNSPNSDTSVKPITMTVLRFTRNMDDLIASHSVIISHGGSGTILEVLRHPNHPSLLTVVNESLMHNHQRELASQLAAMGYLRLLTLDSLADEEELYQILREVKGALTDGLGKYWPPVKSTLLPDLLDHEMGFA